MARPRKIWPKAGRSHYYTKIDGRQTRLGPIDKGEAHSMRILERILKGQHAAGPQEPGITFARLADRFLGQSQATNEKETYEVHLYFLQRFKDHVGLRLVSRLVEADLDEWLRKEAKGGGKVAAGGRKGGTRDGQPWGESTQARARAVVLAALNYGTRKLGLPPHPLRHVRPGQAQARQRYLTHEERAAIRGRVKGALADFVLALEQTGGRPFSEVAKVTAADVDMAKGTWALARWKNARKLKGKKRVIFLSEPMKELTGRLTERYKEGPLFRNAAGRPWTRQALTARFRKLAELTGIEGLSAYLYRHAAISDALLRGVPIAVVAELFGTSVQTISKSYSHLEQREDALREAMRKALG